MLQQLRRAAEGSVLETHPHYRTAIGVLGAALSPILILGWALRESEVESSISAYYHTEMRDWFVGTLWVIGVFLLFYRYRPQDGQARSRWKSVKTGTADSWLGKIAGLCAVVVALVPTTPPPESKEAPFTIGTPHGLAAGLLFLCLALFSIVLFGQSRKWRRVYEFHGWTMIVLLVLTGAYVFAPTGFQTSTAHLRPVLILETLLILVFSASWFTKGWEMAAASKQQSVGGAAAGKSLNPPA